MLQLQFMENQKGFKFNKSLEFNIRLPVATDQNSIESH